MRCDECIELPVSLDIHFRVGTRSELDQRFRRAVAGGKQSGQNMSDFVKLAVIEWYESKQQRQEEVSEAEKVKRELETKIRRLEEMIRSGAGVAAGNFPTVAKEEPGDENKIREAEERVNALTDAF